MKNLLQEPIRIPSTLYRLMRALWNIGLFQEVDKGRFQITPLGTYLQKDVEGSVRGMAIIGREK